MTTCQADNMRQTTVPNPMKSTLLESRIALPSLGPSLFEQTYSAVLEAICDGVVPAGAKINQDELAARLGVSRQPLTQALSVLRTQGFVRDAGRRGLIVTPLQRNFFVSLYQLRESLDPMAARLAAQHHTPASLRSGRKLLKDGRIAILSDSLATMSSADMGFHVWIYETAGNPLLTDTMRLYWHHLRRAMTVVLGPSEDRELVWDEHESIFQAIAAGDQTLAAARTQKHIRDAALRVIDGLPA